MGRYQGKKPKDPRGQFIRIYHEIVNSPSWQSLSASSIRVYLAMRVSLNGYNNGDISATLSKLKAYGISSSATLSKALKELEALGLIEKTRQGGIAVGNKYCSLYRFTDEVVFDHPKKGIVAQAATNDWKLISNKAQARTLIKNLVHKDKNKGLRSLKQIDSKSELSEDVYVSKIEHGYPSSFQ